MTNFDPQDEIKIPKVEVDVNPDIDPVSDRQLSEKFSQVMQSFLRWYDRLPGAAKIAVAIGIIFFSLSLLTKVLHLVASLISVSILAVILYVLYRTFLNSDSTQNN